MKYRINYFEVISQTNSISDDAFQLSSLVKPLEQMEQDCRAVWKGQAADALISKLSTSCSKMNRTGSQMSNLAPTIKYCANGIQHEDREAEERAVTPKSGH